MHRGTAYVAPKHVRNHMHTHSIGGELTRGRSWLSIITIGACYRALLVLQCLITLSFSLQADHGALVDLLSTVDPIRRFQQHLHTARKW